MSDQISDDLPQYHPPTDDPSQRLMDDQTDDVTEVAGYMPLVIDDKRVCRRCARPLGPGTTDNLASKTAFCADCAPTIIRLLVAQSQAQRARVAAVESVATIPDTRGRVPGKRYIVLTPARGVDDAWNVLRRFVLPTRRLEREVTKSERCEVMFTDLESAMQVADPGVDRDAIVTRGDAPQTGPSESLGRRVLEFDIADILDHNATLAQRHQHAERLMFHYIAEEKRLRPAERDMPVVPSEYLTKDVVQIATDIVAGPWSVPEHDGSKGMTHKCRGCHTALRWSTYDAKAQSVCARCAFGALGVLAPAVLAAHRLLVASQEHDRDEVTRAIGTASEGSGS